MARKSKRPRSESKAASGPRELDPNDAKVGRLTTYEDVADSEDEFYLNQDRIALDEDPAVKRRRLNRDPAFDDSDEEVLDLEALPSSDDDDDDDDDDDSGEDPDAAQLSEDDDDDEDAEGGMQDEYADWGKSKKNYYDANDIEDEDDAAMEEAEALRIQQRQLKSMSAKDFGVDESDWNAPADDHATAGAESAEGPETYDTAPTRKIKVPASKEGKEELLQMLHPEFEPLRKEYLRLTPLHPEIMQKGMERTNPASPARRRWIVLSAYLAVLSMYFAFLSQPRPEGEVVDIKDHEIMEALLKWRMEWLKVEGAADEATPPPESELDREMEDMSLDDEEWEEDSDEEDGEEEEEEGDDDDDDDDDDGEEEKEEEEEKIVLPVAKPHTNGTKVRTDVSRVEVKSKKAKSTAETKEARRLAKSDASLKDLDDLLPSTSSRQKPSKAKAAVQFRDDDFGEEDFIYEDDAEEKAKRKKSLRFYTAQIHQKSNKRDRAGRDAGGDLDVPNRERNKERQERLNVEAQRRGAADGLGANLDDQDFDDSDYDNDLTGAARALKDQVEHDGDALDYYNKVAAKAGLEKLKKKLEQEAAQTNDRVVETETVDPATGKRAIGYTIEKNKGLTPHRKKDVRNPRVKKRKKFEAAKKKLASTKAIYKPPTGAYGGEATGIRTKIIKSVKFS
ncbi:hypothetical protein DRE_00176 [Drechslerella stenobrocha 248]|uniref:Sas10 C-terminal domain-containing protein n=1 Tax=Drechslerella stenobrocha 248 TaxID=1043628 RepID=W7HXD8_9PEZI|nr:hypothetical protein DRE_00176 [Drechslerella stenobrocha 248]